jgi:hypothetical protein
VPEAQVCDKPMSSIMHRDPQSEVLRLVYGRFIGNAVCLAAKLGIADHIAAGRNRTEDLATVLNATPPSLRRLLKALASYGLLQETSDTWANTPAGSLLRGDVPNSLRDLARLFASQEHATSWLQLEHSVLTGGSAFEHAHGTDGFSYGRQVPAFDAIFNAAMSSVVGTVHRAIAETYDFSGVKLLVDVGGGHGRLMARILKRFVHLHGIVFDLPHVISGASTHLAEEGLASRCRVVAGDFFEGVPAGADAYLMTAILHDWDDNACVRILRHCRDVMHPTGRVLLGEFVLRPANEPDFGRIIDLEMLVVTGGGRERTASEFQDLLAQARLSLRRIIALPSGNSLIEAVRQTQN